MEPSNTDHDDEARTASSRKLMRAGGGLLLMILLSSIVALGSFPPATTRLLTDNSSHQEHEEKPQPQQEQDLVSLVEERKLYLNCATDDQCPQLYCPQLPCTAFICSPDKECVVTTLTIAPSGPPAAASSGTLGGMFDSPTTATPTTATPTTATPTTASPTKGMAVTPTTNPPTSSQPVTLPPTSTAPVTSPPTNPPAPTTALPTTLTPTANALYMYANNDRCASAVGPLPWTAQGLGPNRINITHGTTFDATFDGTQAAPICGNNIAHTGPGVWYTVIGTGDQMTASTCHPGTAYDTAITVMQGGGGRRALSSGGNSRQRGLRRNLKNDDKNKDKDDNGGGNQGNQGGGGGGGNQQGNQGQGNQGGGGCNNLQCVAANDDAGGFCSVSTMHSTVRWDSVRGRTYYLLVHGFNNRQGNFDLNIINARPHNERCEDAVTLPIGGDHVIGTTFQANEPWGENGSTQCAGQFHLIGDTSSVWYHVNSPFTQTLEASTCNPLTDFDTKLHIFENTCMNSGGCIGGSHKANAPGICSTFSWTAEGGKDYYILIHGFMVDSGLFELSLKAL